MVKMVPLETQGRTEPRDKMVNLANLVLKVTQELVERRASLEMPDKMESQESQVKKDAMGFQEFLGRRVAQEKRASLERQERTETKEIKALRDSRVHPVPPDPRDLQETKELKEIPAKASREHKENREIRETLVHPATQAPLVTTEQREMAETRVRKEKKALRETWVIREKKVTRENLASTEIRVFQATKEKLVLRDKKDPTEQTAQQG